MTTIERYKKYYLNVKENYDKEKHLLFFRPKAYIDTNQEVFIKVNDITSSLHGGEYYIINKKHKKVYKNIKKGKRYKSKNLTIDINNLIDFLDCYNEDFKYKKLKEIDDGNK